MSEAVHDRADVNIEINYNYPQPKQLVPPEWVQKLELTDLPRLPIPPLKDTLRRYIETVTPLLSDEELAETKKKAEKFAQYDGPMLDAQLHQLQHQSPTSWIEGFWDTMYLEWRDSVAIHSNPCFVLQDDPTPERNAQVIRAASLVYSTIWFINLIRTDLLAPDSERNVRLCMHQYTKLFGTSRIPQYRRDKLVTDYNARHIAVVARDQYYWFDAYDEDNKPLEIEELQRHIKFILDDAKRTEAKSETPIPPLGMLTTTDRENWTTYYNKLLKLDPRNGEFLEKLNTSLFLLCLDQQMPSNLVETGKIALHSDGRNRWFDKSIQLIVCQNGKSGINMEHSAFDGHTTTRFAEDMFNHSVRTRCDSPSSFSAFDTANKSNPVPPAVYKLEFKLSQEIRDEIDRATIEFNELAGRCCHEIVHFVPFGKRFIIQHKLSPDALVQLAYHLTYYRITGSVGSTYESAMTKQFFHGRTECMRSLTNDIVSFLKMVSDPSSSALDQIKTLRNTLNTHGKLVNLAKKNEGVDRHLWGLFNLAKQQQSRLTGT
eukprot:TRINITY_DN2894_c0_g1_i2.p1 TRINITY_DN2894_c0_g1~~TRINITY_DN2894_c0_g1_i2.p1  ORF type:complete len:544 (-),score=107.12 TRINITY_DN2894_c0_g1_i2:387-2018(-)